MATVAQLLGWSCSFREWIQRSAHQHQPHQAGIITSTVMGFGLASPLSSVTHSLLAEATARPSQWDKPQPFRLELRGTKPSSPSPAFAPADIQGSLPTTLIPPNLPFLPFLSPLQHQGWTEQQRWLRAGGSHTSGDVYHTLGLESSQLRRSHTLGRSVGGAKDTESSSALPVSSSRISLGDLHPKRRPRIARNGDHMEALIAC